MSRMVVRNKQTFWYAPYQGTVEGYIQYGGSVGLATHATYGPVVEEHGNISAARGSVAARQFGDDEKYDKVIVLGDRDTPIDEHFVLWIDTGAPTLALDGTPQVDDNGNYVTPWDYVVRKVGRGLPGYAGSAVIAVSKVNVT